MMNPIRLSQSPVQPLAPPTHQPDDVRSSTAPASDVVDIISPAGAQVAAAGSTGPSCPQPPAPATHRAAARVPSPTFAQLATPAQLGPIKAFWGAPNADPQDWSRGIELSCMKELQGGMPRLEAAELAMHRAGRDVAVAAKTLRNTESLLAQMRSSLETIEQLESAGVATFFVNNIRAQEGLVEQFTDALKNEQNWFARTKANYEGML